MGDRSDEAENTGPAHLEGAAPRPDATGDEELSVGPPPAGRDRWSGSGPGRGGLLWGTPPLWPEAAAAPPRRRRSVRSIAVAALLVAMVGAGVGIGHVVWSAGAPASASAGPPGFSSGGSGFPDPYPGLGGGNPLTGPSGSAVPGGGSGQSSPASSGPADVSSVAARVDPAVVDINVTFDGQVPGAGTGIVLTPGGEILTNNHVVEGATSLRVTDVGNGKTYGGTVVGYDATADVAVVQLTDASGLQTAEIGSSSKVAVGDPVVAIGNAGGTGGTPTASGGSVTALDQAITATDELSGTSEDLTGLIATNADIQPGDSGGPLVSSAGRVIGMDTAAAQGFSLSAQASQGFAIPIDKALSIASQIVSGAGSSNVHVGATAYLGVLVSTSSSSTQPNPGGSLDPFGGQNGSTGSGGALVSGVVPGGPAAGAGLAEGDVITSLGGQRVTSASGLTRLIQRYEPGDRVEVGWTDGTGSTHTATVTLGTGPAQ